MSSNALVDEDVVQTLQDDMESLFYVVLYCSLRWLPHSDTDESVSARINALFHHSHCIGGQMLGGDAKISLLRSRAFARDITWANAGVQQWVNTVLDYRSPQGHPNPLIFPESWSDPRHLDIFWGGFLTSLSREPNDRIERDLENSSFGSAVETSESDSSSVSSAKQDTPKAPSQGPDSAMHQIEPVIGRLTRSKTRLALQQAGPNKRASGRPTPSLVKGPIAVRKTATPGRGRGTVRSGRGRGDQTKMQPRAL
ncbi:hypothetical protein A0H81_08674 [Grifola frondosa]|uniref:Fungal-type protein kinase domain-containing protein n=1 Tax=Grifola frondosa TaxID=5627 RepID=A0A1C7M3R4_GRIFR|nr:hypothetical protein A0H81_08674 [Grifola frondosa]